MMKARSMRRKVSGVVAPKITASIPRELFEEFDRFVASNGYVKERAIAGAIRVFMASDDASRVAAIRGD
jgi:metal-responsive CopG/Arc/MetJ family transcriptional regulator